MLSGPQLVGAISRSALVACTSVPRKAAPLSRFAGPVAPVGFSPSIRSLGVDRGFYLAHTEEMSHDNARQSGFRLTRAGASVACASRANRGTPWTLHQCE